MDPLLLSSTPTLPVLATSLDDDFPIPTSGGSSKVVVEGVLPTPSTKLLEKIMKLGVHGPKPSSGRSSYSVSGYQKSTKCPQMARF